MVVLVSRPLGGSDPQGLGKEVVLVEVGKEVYLVVVLVGKEVDLVLVLMVLMAQGLVYHISVHYP